MLQARLNITKTRAIAKPTYYVGAILGEYSAHAYDEERAVALKGEWRSTGFGATEDHPMDLEIGTGHGLFFTHRALKHPERLLVGIEISFKPLIQAIRRALNHGAKNVRMVRYHGGFIDNLFSAGELNHVFIHHPDPWTKRKKHKHRLLQRHFLHKLWNLQRPNAFVDFKTDSQDYFTWAAEEFRHSAYKIERYTENLHSSEWSGENFTTQFESIFLKQGLPIYYLRAVKN